MRRWRRRWRRRPEPATGRACIRSTQAISASASFGSLVERYGARAWRAPASFPRGELCGGPAPAQRVYSYTALVMQAEPVVQRHHAGAAAAPTGRRAPVRSPRLPGHARTSPARPLTPLDPPVDAQVLQARGFVFCDEGDAEAPQFGPLQVRMPLMCWPGSSSSACVPAVCAALLIIPLPGLSDPQLKEGEEQLIAAGVEASSTDAPQQGIGARAGVAAAVGCAAASAAGRPGCRPQGKPAHVSFLLGRRAAPASLLRCALQLPPTPPVPSPLPPPQAAPCRTRAGRFGAAAARAAPKLWSFCCTSSGAWCGLVVPRYYLPNRSNAEDGPAATRRCSSRRCCCARCGAPRAPSRHSCRPHASRRSPLCLVRAVRLTVFRARYQVGGTRRG